MHTISTDPGHKFHRRDAETQREQRSIMRIPNTMQRNKLKGDGRWTLSPYNCPLRNNSIVLSCLRVSAVTESLS
jgi:hypothetical protein